MSPLPAKDLGASRARGKDVYCEQGICGLIHLKQSAQIAWQLFGDFAEKAQKKPPWQAALFRVRQFVATLAGSDGLATDGKASVV